MARIRITDKRLQIKQQREDVAKYNTMLDGLIATLNEAGIPASFRGEDRASPPIVIETLSDKRKLFEVSPIGLGEQDTLRYITFRVYDKQVFPLVKLFPVSPALEAKLHTIRISVYNPNAFDPIKKIAENYGTENRYHHLESIIIEKEF